MNWIDTELVLVSLAAMLSPTTLSFSVLALVLGDRPLRTGLWFYLGAFGSTLVVGIIAAFVIGDVASSDTSTAKTSVAAINIVAAALLLAYVARLLRRPPDPKRIGGMVDRMEKVASSPAIAIVGAGAALANPGGFIPIALKTISQTDPSAAGYLVQWVFFALASLLPLAVALVLLLVARTWTERRLGNTRDWLIAHARTIAAIIIVLLAAALLRNGIAELNSLS